MLALLIMIGAGAVACKINLLDEHTNSRLTSLIVVIFNPMLIFSSAANAVGQITFDRLIVVGAIATVMFIAFIFLGMIMKGIFEKDIEKKRIWQLMFVFNNAGFIGIPVVSTVLGPKYVVYVTVFIVIWNIIFYTYGIAVMEGRFDIKSIKSIVNPGTVFSVLGLLLIAFEIHLPGFIVTASTYIGDVTPAVALMLVGYSIMKADLKAILRNSKLYIFTFIKMLIIPLIMCFVLKLFISDMDVINVCTIEFGMPVGNMPLMLALQKGMDGSDCSAAIILTTLFCVISVPLLLAFAAI